MSKLKKALANQLLIAIAPYLGDTAAGKQPSKAVAKTVQKLAKQLLKQQAKAPQTGGVTPTTKQGRKHLAGELTQSLQPYLSETAEGTSEPPKVVTKAIKRLAGELTKQRRKQIKRAVTADQRTGAVEEASPTATAKSPRVRAKSAPAPKRSVGKRSSAPAPTAPAVDSSLDA